jgi:hypothetical protein
LSDNPRLEQFQQRLADLQIDQLTLEQINGTKPLDMSQATALFFKLSGLGLESGKISQFVSSYSLPSTDKPTNS